VWGREPPAQSRERGKHFQRRWAHMYVWTLPCLLWLAFGSFGSALIATGKERSPIIWGFLGFLFGIFAMVVVALLPYKHPRGGIAQTDRLPSNAAADSRARLTARHAQRPTTTLPATSSLKTRISGTKIEPPPH
jgi:hypothetical protein